LFNQVKFADACDFNNVYVYAVPKLEKLTSLTTRSNYLNPALKQLVINDLQQVKLTTAEIIINDPVYVAIDIATRFSNENLTPEITNNSYLEITRDLTSKRNPEALKQQVSDIFTEYFSTVKDNLGLTISLTDITNQILSLEGVRGINTIRTEQGTTISTPGISLLIYNPVYPFTDITITTQDLQLPYFKFPFLNNPLDFADKIIVETPSIQVLQSEF